MASKSAQDAVLAWLLLFVATVAAPWFFGFTSPRILLLLLLNTGIAAGIYGLRQWQSQRRRRKLMAGGKASGAEGDDSRGAAA